MYQSAVKLAANEHRVIREGYQNADRRESVVKFDSSIRETLPIFLSEVRKAREESPGICSFSVSVFILLISFIVWTIALIVIVTVPLAMIFIGVEYLHECPVQRMIPISLIVAGTVALACNIVVYFVNFKRFSETDQPKTYTVVEWIKILLYLFLASWFIATCIWVYGAAVQFKDDSALTYCNPHLYAFVYWLLNFIFIFLGAMMVVYALMMCFALMYW